MFVISGGKSAFARDLENNGPTHRALRHLTWPLRPVNDLRALFELRSVLKGIDPDLVSTHTSKAGILGRVAAWSLGLPNVLTAHGLGYSKGRPLIERCGFWLAERSVSPITTRIITVCESDRETALQLRMGPPERFVTVHNAMPDVGPELRADPEQAPPRLVMVARFAPEKDHELLLRALSGLDDVEWSLDLLGDGRSLASYESLAQTLGLKDRVRFLGFRSDVADILARSQIFVLATKWEGFPRSILEAMRAGLPVVASDVGGICESVEEGKTGYIVPSGDIISLRRRLADLLRAPRLRRTMGDAGRARYEERFTFDRLVEQTLAVYGRILSRPRG